MLWTQFENKQKIRILHWKISQQLKKKTIKSKINFIGQKKTLWKNITKNLLSMLFRWTQKDEKINVFRHLNRATKKKEKWLSEIEKNLKFPSKSSKHVNNIIKFTSGWFLSKLHRQETKQYCNMPANQNRTNLNYIYLFLHLNYSFKSARNRPKNNSQGCHGLSLEWGLQSDTFVIKNFLLIVLST